MLEHRLEVFEGMEDKITQIAMENNKNKTVHEDHRKKMIEEIGNLKLD